MRTYIKRANGDCWSGEEWINLDSVIGGRDACDFQTYEAAAGYLDAAIASGKEEQFADARVVTVDDAPVSFEVRMSDCVENTGLDCQRFATRNEAQMAADAVNADHPGAKAEVIEVAGEPTTTFAAWNDA